MLKLYYVLLAIVPFFISCGNQGKDINALRIVFAGDILLDRGVRERIEHQGMGILFHPSVDSVLSKSDIVVANLECPATRIKEPINKMFIFRAEPEWLKILNDHRITHLNLANNHSMDQGRNGLVNTNDMILKNGLVPLGFGMNATEACYAKLIATKPRKVYILSSLHVPSENWTYLEDKPCVCEESFDSIAERIIKLRKSEPNSVIIVNLHWGAEHKLVPMISQIQQAHELIDSGADCIIGHHTHTIQTIEYYKSKPIFYSIGNFIFDQSHQPNTEGLMVKMTVTESDIQFEPIRIVIEKCTPRVMLLPNS